MILINIVKDLFRFVYEIYEKRYLIYELVKRDFKARYMGSLFGLFWAILQPLLMNAIMWFVFTYGLKAGSGPMGVPFVCYLFTGMLAWNFFADSLIGSTNVITEYSFLVKKINFRLSILPIVKILSASILSFIFLLIVILILFYNKIYPSFWWSQFLYYMAASMFLALGLSWITSAMNVFLKDIFYIVSIFIQFGFWMTPIFWDITVLPESWRVFVKLNPMAYIVNGYRDSFLYNKPFWQGDLFSIIYFWSFTLAALLIGIIVFKRLRPHFADVI